MAGLIDSHTHLESFIRKGELPQVLDECRQTGVDFLITVGTNPGDWSLYQETVSAYPGQIAHTVGLHPSMVEEDWRDAVRRLSSLLESAGKHRPIAVGETGLDGFHLPSEADHANQIRQRQRDSFAFHLELATRHSLPVVVHSRHAFEDCLEVIRESGFDWTRVVFHCFAEDGVAIRKTNALGARGSFTGILTYPKAAEVRQALLEQGIERLMLETDAPYLAPVPMRGKPNRPAFLAHTASTAADILQVPLTELVRHATANTRDFFRLPAGPA